MLDDVIGYLACPHCGAGLARAGGVLRCGSGHAFDIARQGYVSMLPGGGRAGGGLAGTGDTAAMVAARDDFLAAGHYAGLAGEVAQAAAEAVAAQGGAAEAVAAEAVAGETAAGETAAGETAVGEAVAGCVVDVGAGTGYYLAAVLDRLPGRAGLALDASKFAARRAARAHDRVGAVVADAWHRLPVADQSAAVVLNVFAPRGGAELRRIVNPAGALVVVTPNQEHLAELAGPLGLLAVDPRKQERLAGTLGLHFDLDRQHEYRASLRLGHADTAAVVGMGPSAWHTGAQTLADRIGALPTAVAVTVSVTVSVFRPAAR